MTTEKPSSSLAGPHALWLQYLNDMTGAVGQQVASESMFNVSLTAMMVGDPLETVTMLRDIAQRIEDDAEQMQRNAAIAKAERRAH